ncbi:hydrogenase maturation protease [Methylocaldum szegediense]|jgi:hydrogenase maturation protease|uniref:hydrogenase maturation protease n=1 Tax=Methylocaldum szegediense TaxID=73780 RepID=UPI0003F67286|nr:hydrogenase maturation protease [Methylocaldum szegediense]
MTPIRIQGLGSPLGDDRVGWIAVENLVQSDGFRALPEGFASAEIPDPVGNNLLDAMRDASLVILIDAAQSGTPAGTIHRLDAENFENGAAPYSSYGFGLSATLALGRALTELPPNAILFLIEIPATAEFGRASIPSAPVTGAMPGVIAAVLADIRRWADS